MKKRNRTVYNLFHTVKWPLIKTLVIKIHLSYICLKYTISLYRVATRTLIKEKTSRHSFSNYYIFFVSTELMNLI